MTQRAGKKQRVGALHQTCTRHHSTFAIDLKEVLRVNGEPYGFAGALVK